MTEASNQHGHSDMHEPTTPKGAGSAAPEERRMPHAPAAADPAPSGAPAPLSTLDSPQNYCCPPRLTRSDVRRQRWHARAILWRSSLLKAVRSCGAQPGVRRLDDGEVHESRTVTLNRYSDSGDGVAGVGGLMSCGSVWSCPRCSALVAFERAAEMARVLDQCRELGGRAYLLTLTLRHTRGDELAALWELLSAGWRSAFGTRAWTGASASSRRARRVGDRERFGVAGLCRVVEATVSRPGTGSGWHVHMHVLVFCPRSLISGLSSSWAHQLRAMGISCSVDDDWLSRQLFFCRILERWSAGVVRAGGSPVLGAACDIRAVDLHEDEFVSLYLAKSTYQAQESAAMEVVGGQPVKIASGDRLSPFELLAELVASGPRFGVRTSRSWSVEALETGFAIVDHATGEIEEITSPGLWQLWHEWEIASKGRRQVMWSRRGTGTDQLSHFWSEMLRARGQTVDDEQVARRGKYGETVASIPIDAWRGHLVWRPSEIAKLVEAAAQGREALREACKELDAPVDVM